MTKKQLRKEFEKIWTIPDGVEWDDSYIGQCYTCMEDNEEDWKNAVNTTWLLRMYIAGYEKGNFIDKEPSGDVGVFDQDEFIEILKNQIELYNKKEVTPDAE